MYLNSFDWLHFPIQKLTKKALSPLQGGRVEWSFSGMERRGYVNENQCDIHNVPATPEAKVKQSETEGVCRLGFMRPHTTTCPALEIPISRYPSLQLHPPPRSATHPAAGTHPLRQQTHPHTVPPPRLRAYYKRSRTTVSETNVLQLTP